MNEGRKLFAAIDGVLSSVLGARAHPDTAPPDQPHAFSDNFAGAHARGMNYRDLAPAQRGSGQNVAVSQKIQRIGAIENPPGSGNFTFLDADIPGAFFPDDPFFTLAPGQSIVTQTLSQPYDWAFVSARVVIFHTFKLSCAVYFRLYLGEGLVTCWMPCYSIVQTKQLATPGADYYVEVPYLLSIVHCRFDKIEFKNFSTGSVNDDTWTLYGVVGAGNAHLQPLFGIPGT